MTSASANVCLDKVFKSYGQTVVLHEVNLTINAGEFFVMLGPSGSGKSTTLRILAGLEEVSSGRILMDGVDVTSKEPGERDVAMVFQSYALYPHMTVAQNIGFPLKMVKKPKAEIEQKVKEAAEKVEISHLLQRMPGQLSGGQQQRVALARAIIRQPKLFLLDEPLSNLDAKLRLDMRLELHKLQKSLDTTTVYVTHDQEEAMTLADRIAIFMDGKIVQIGTPREIFVTPSTAAVAGFIGTPPMNLLPGNWLGTSVNVNGCALQVPYESNKSYPVILGVRPNDICIVPDGMPAIVERVEDLGDSTITSFRDAQGTLIKMKKNSESTVNEGELVTLGFIPQAAHLFDALNGKRI